MYNIQLYNMVVFYIIIENLSETQMKIQYNTVHPR